MKKNETKYTVKLQGSKANKVPTNSHIHLDENQTALKSRKKMKIYYHGILVRG